MQFQHIVLPGEKSKAYNELTNVEIGINTAAIKNLALSKACTIPGAFSPIQSKKIEDQLMAAVWQDLAEDGKYRVGHFFLPYDIRILSIAAYAADNWLKLMCITKAQCKEISHKCGEVPEIHSPDTSPDHPCAISTASDTIKAFANEYATSLEEMQKCKTHIHQSDPDWQDEDWNTEVPDFSVLGYDQHYIPRPHGRTKLICSPVMRCPLGTKFLDSDKSHSPPDENTPARTNYQKYRKDRVMYQYHTSMCLCVLMSLFYVCKMK
jgi:hypothetical protein